MSCYGLILNKCAQAFAHYCTQFAQLISASGFSATKPRGSFITARGGARAICWLGRRAISARGREHLGCRQRARLIDGAGISVGRARGRWPCLQIGRRARMISRAMPRRVMARRITPDDERFRRASSSSAAWAAEARDGPHIAAYRRKSRHYDRSARRGSKMTATNRRSSLMRVYNRREAARRRQLLWRE